MNGVLKFVILCFFVATARPAGANAPQFDPRYPGWNQVLQQFVKDGGVDYPALKNNPARLNVFLQSVSDLSKREYEGWNGEQKIAFWINTYNALAIKVVLDHYPPQKGLSWKALAYPETSIQQIPNVWDQNLIRIFGEDFSLNRIEHEILRKEFQEPRVHFAMVCASIGCPVLREEPFRAEVLGQQLDDQVRQFLSTSGKFHYDGEKGVLYLSPVFKWFRKDFDQDGGMIPFIKKYTPGDRANAISEKSKIEWLDYDWSLNERTGRL